MTLTPHQLAALRAAKDRATATPWDIENDPPDTAENLALIILLANSADALLDAAEENARLRKALGWYALGGNTDEDNGEVARTALKGTA